MSSDPRRHNDLSDDFFSLGEAPKKKKKKHSLPEPEPQALFENLNNPSEPKSVPEPQQPVQSKIRTVSPLSSDDEIVIISVDSSKAKKPKRSPKKPVTKKPFFRASIKLDSDTSEDNFDDNLDMYDSIVNSVSSSYRASETSGYSFSDVLEKDRPYLVRIVPKFLANTVIDFTTKGTKVFDKIMDSVIQYYVSKKLFPASTKLSQMAIFWVEGKREIQPFYKPSTLRIPPPEPSELVYIKDKGHTKISCLLIPKDEVKDAFTKYDELKLKSFTFEADDEEPELEDISDVDITFNPAELNGSPEKAVEKTFRVGLRGHDNKKVEMLVTKNTKIEDLLWKFVEVKEIDPKTVNKRKARLLFDDEELNFRKHIGDTELEDQYEVQVVL